MYEIALIGGGVILGVAHHAYLQPRLAKAWAWIRARLSPDGTGG